MAPNTAQKRRKLSLFGTIRVRNGGAITDHITPANTPEDAADDGSDTEDEADEETAQYYLNKMTDDMDRKTETVFGPGVEVWTSHGGTVYADLNDRVKRKMKEQELWNQDAKQKVEGGLKRKLAPSFDQHHHVQDSDNKTDTVVVPDGQVRYPVLRDPNEDDHHDHRPNNKTILPIPDPPPALSPKAPYPSRNPNTTQFCHSSAGIDPLGAYNRPVKPLPKRPLPTSSTIPSAISCPLPPQTGSTYLASPVYPASKVLCSHTKRPEPDTNSSPTRSAWREPVASFESGSSGSSF
jgi:hypothetical protein